MRKIAMAVTVVAVLALIDVAQGKEAQKPDATLQLRGGSIAAGVGVSWASGTLTYKGKDYPISVSGLSVGDVGATKLAASGKVYDLKKLEDFNGNYTTVGAGATVAGGASAVTAKNQNGVRADLVSTTQGVKFTLGAAGVEMKIKE
jgi:hypothetical protein